jgi:hypothetical protein
MMKLIIPIVLTLCITLSCEKEPPVLPEISSSGKNTFGCELKGQVFIPKRTGSYHAVWYRDYF